MMLEASTRLLGLRLGSAVTLLPSHLSKTSHRASPDCRWGDNTRARMLGVGSRGASFSH